MSTQIQNSNSSIQSSGIQIPNQNYKNIKGKIELGVCCIINELRKCKDKNNRNIEIFSGRTINARKHYTVEKAKQKALQNLSDLLLLLEYCYTHNIKCFRIGSDIFPRFTDPEVERYTMDFADSALKKVGELAKKYGIYLLMHPCQICNLGSPSEEVFKMTKDILEYHCEILDRIGVGSESVLIIHGGGVYGDIESTKERWCKRFNMLNQGVRSRLVIENCERGYNVRDCLEISEKCGIPVVFDTHHYECYNIVNPGKFTEDIGELLGEVVESWRERRCVMHISSQREFSKLGAHSDFIEKIPGFLLDFLEGNDVKIYLEVEAKMKECAVYKLKEMYSDLF